MYQRIRLLHANELERRKGGGSKGHSASTAKHSTSTKSSSSDDDDDDGSSSSSSSSTTISITKGAKPAFSNSVAAHPFTITSGSAVAYSDGGGKLFKLGSSTPFPGREAGSGDRNQVFGTSRYGSGYPYGVSDSYISNRPFPYVFYPVTVTNYDYYGSDEFANITSTERPGGNLAEAIIQPLNNTGNVTFRIVGDNASVATVFAAVVSNCSVLNSSTAISPFTPSPTTYPLPEQIVQWYRASTFALSLDSYNNSAALLSNMPSSGSLPALPLSADTPLPSGLNMSFLECVNQTIGASVPLLAPSTSHLSHTEIALIVLGSIAAAIFLALFGLKLYALGEQRLLNKLRLNRVAVPPVDFEKHYEKCPRTSFDEAMEEKSDD